MAVVKRHLTRSWRPYCWLSALRPSLGSVLIPGFSVASRWLSRAFQARRFSSAIPPTVRLSVVVLRHCTLLTFHDRSRCQRRMSSAALLP